MCTLCAGEVSVYSRCWRGQGVLCVLKRSVCVCTLCAGEVSVCVLYVLERSVCALCAKVSQHPPTRYELLY